MATCRGFSIGIVGGGDPAWKVLTRALVAIASSKIVAIYPEGTIAGSGGLVDSWAPSYGIAGTLTPSATGKFTLAADGTRKYISNNAGTSDKLLGSTLPSTLIREAWLVARSDELPFANFRGAVQAIGGSTARFFMGALSSSSWYVPSAGDYARDGSATADVASGWHVYKHRFLAGSGYDHYTATSLRIGGDGAADRVWLGGIQFVMVMGATTTDGESSSIFSALMSYHGVT